MECRVIKHQASFGCVQLVATEDNGDKLCTIDIRTNFEFVKALVTSQNGSHLYLVLMNKKHIDAPTSRFEAAVKSLFPDQLVKEIAKLTSDGLNSPNFIPFKGTNFVIEGAPYHPISGMEAARYFLQPSIAFLRRRDAETLQDNIRMAKRDYEDQICRSMLYGLYERGMKKEDGRPLLIKNILNIVDPT